MKIDRLRKLRFDMATLSRTSSYLSGYFAEGELEEIFKLAEEAILVRQVVQDGVPLGGILRGAAQAQEEEALVRTPLRQSKV